MYELKILYILGFCHCRRKEFKQGIKYIEKCIEISEEIKIFYEYGSLKMLRGLAYTYLKEYEKGLLYTKEALYFFKSVNNITYMAACLINMGVINKYQKRYDKAIFVLKEALKITKEEGIDNYYQNCIYELSITLFLSGNYIECKKILDENKKHVQIFPLKGKIFYILSCLSRKFEHYEEALEYIEKAYKIFTDEKLLHWQAKCLAEMAEIYKCKEDLEKSFFYYRESISLYDTFIE